MKSKEEIKKILDENQEFRDVLFRRGYLITDNDNINTEDYPFYELWTKKKIGLYNFIVHKDQDFYAHEEDDYKIVMIGHAYNPFDMKYQEKELLKDCIVAYKIGKEKFFEKISEFTGIHVIVLLVGGGRNALCARLWRN